MKKAGSTKSKPSKAALQFVAEAEYAESIFRDALGDSQGCLDALMRSYELNPAYAPTLLSLGSVEYQLGRKAEGRDLFQALLSLPTDTPELDVILDEAGTFLIQSEEYEDGLMLFRAAREMFPDAFALHQGFGCCAGHAGIHDEAIAASRRALDLAPDNQRLVNDLGWSLFEAGEIEEAETTLERAAAMDPADGLARENLRRCQAKSARWRKQTAAPKRARAKKK